MTKTKRTGGMVLGILFIGLCVSFLRLSQFGVDPFSAMNLGISGFIGWSFGTWQLLVNAIILVVVFFQARSCIGAGTIINMVFVGYIADFICYVANDVVQIQMNLPLRILALLLALLYIFCGFPVHGCAGCLCSDCWHWSALCSGRHPSSLPSGGTDRVHHRFFLSYIGARK